MENTEISQFWGENGIVLSSDWWYIYNNYANSYQAI